MRALLIWMALVAVFFPLESGCGEDIVHAAVSIPPQRYFVERIGGGSVAVTVMVSPGSDPHTYEPKPRQLAELSGKDVYFAIGVTFERAWLDRFASVNPRMRVVHTDEGIEKIPVSGEHGGHGEDEADGHDHVAPDPHIWLSPKLVKQQAAVIFETLADMNPENREAYHKRYLSFVGEIDALDGRLNSLFGKAPGKRAFMVFHPSWGYFARDYGLEQVAVETGGKEPKPADLGRLITFAREHGIRAVFVQPQLSRRSAETIADAVGGRIVVADPLAANWAGNLETVAEKLREALR